MAIFGQDMLFNIPFLANWNKIGDYRQCQTDLNTEHENRTRKDWGYQVRNKVLLWRDGIFRKSESRYERDPWTITSVHTNGTIRVQCRTKSEWLNIGHWVSNTLLWQLKLIQVIYVSLSKQALCIHNLPIFFPPMRFFSHHHKCTICGGEWHRPWISLQG